VEDTISLGNWRDMGEKLTNIANLAGGRNYARCGIHVQR